MTKLSRKKLDPEKFGYYINNLWAAFTLANSKDDIRLLFKDLFTHTEYKMFAKRLEIARRLLAEETYEGIEKELKVTSATISKISNILIEKGNGLRKAHEQLNKLDKALQKKTPINSHDSSPFSFLKPTKTVTGTLMRIGMKELDKKISRTIKNRSAKKQLSLN